MTKGNMKINNAGSVCYLTFPGFERYGFVRHAFSTRIGGVSKNEFSSMNLNFNRGDKNENVLENYHKFCNAAGFDFNSLVASAQNHKTFIRRVGKNNCGTGIWKPQDMQSVDGLITNETDVTLVTYYADCVPLFFVDTQNKAIGLAHAGWRGTAAKIGAKTVAAMNHEFGSKPENIAAAIGPSIGPCCFEVDSVVRDAFAKMEELRPFEFIRCDGGGKFHIDLWEANKRVIMQTGVLEKNIAVAGICTKCNSDWLFSHRASGVKRGGLAAFLAIKGDLNDN